MCNDVRARITEEDNFKITRCFPTGNHVLARFSMNSHNHAEVLKTPISRNGILKILRSKTLVSIKMKFVIIILH